MVTVKIIINSIDSKVDTRLEIDKHEVTRVEVEMLKRVLVPLLDDLASDAVESEPIIETTAKPMKTANPKGKA